MNINKVTIDYYEDLGKTSIEVTGSEAFIQRTVPHLLNRNTSYPELATQSKPIESSNQNNLAEINKEYKENQATESPKAFANGGIHAHNSTLGGYSISDIFKTGQSGTGAFTSQLDDYITKEVERLDELIKGNTNDDNVQAIINGDIEIGVSTSYLDVNHPLHHYQTGILINNELDKRFKCRYRCSSCKHEANRYITMAQPYVNCHNCNYEMRVRNIGSESTDYDDFNNFYIAGDKTE